MWTVSFQFVFDPLFVRLLFYIVRKVHVKDFKRGSSFVCFESIGVDPQVNRIGERCVKLEQTLETSASQMQSPEGTGWRNNQVNMVLTQRSIKRFSLLCSWTCRKLSVGNLTLKIIYVLEKKQLPLQGLLKLVEISCNPGNFSNWKSQKNRATISFKVIKIYFNTPQKWYHWTDKCPSIAQILCFSKDF